MENVTSKKYFWILLDILIAVAIISVFFSVMPALQKFGDSFAPARIMTVSAEGKTTAPPDTAQFSFSAVSQGVDTEKLSADVSQKIAAVVAYLKTEGVDPGDVKTADYNLLPNYSYDKNTGKSYIYNYTLTETMLVKVRDLAKIGKIVGGLAPLGINQVSGISFTIDDPDRVLLQARDDAFKKAQAKAREMAQDNGVRLGKIVGITEYQNQPVPYANERVYGMGASVAAPLAAIEPGTQEIKVQVSLTYSIE